VKRWIGARPAANLLLAGLGALAVFHLLLLFRVVPAGIAWGGRATTSPGTLFALELAGLAVTALFAAIVAGKARYLKAPKLRSLWTIGVWIIFVYFLLNTAGNLTSLSSMERAVFTPVSALLALLALRLAIER